MVCAKEGDVLARFTFQKMAPCLTFWESAERTGCRCDEPSVRDRGVNMRNLHLGHGSRGCRSLAACRTRTVHSSTSAHPQFPIGLQSEPAVRWHEHLLHKLLLVVSTREQSAVLRHITGTGVCGLPMILQ